MHPPELRARAEQLRGEGLLVREVAEQIGVPKSTVLRWLNPKLEKRERKNALKRKLSRRCPRCRKKMSATARLCLACHKQKHLEERPWTREKVIDAIRAWAAEHGNAPVHGDWDASGKGHPAISSILDGPNPLFGSWSEALLAAGFTPRQRRSKRRLTREQRSAIRRDRREALIKKAVRGENGAATKTEVS